ncbi:MAG: PAS domain-containing protein [Candidatus Omnitrophica bacterium]|nr:PAS domain-containing protein [Candidatus Omnitrophota bacterium]
MMIFWFLIILLVAALVFLISRHFYQRRISQIRYSHDNVRNDYLKQLNTSSLERENFETILSSMVEGVIVIDGKGRIQHASPNFCQLLELRSRETQGKLYWEVIWNQEINDSLKEALQHKRAIRKEINIIGPQESFFSMQISPVLDKQDRLSSLIAVFHDITELKKLEKIRTEFVANVSHELKTPLTAIKGFVETLKTSGKDDLVVRTRFLDIISKQTQRLENLVNDLLILSSIESHEVKMNFSAEPLGPIVTSVVTLHKKAMENKEHQLTINIPEDLPRVLVDRQRIEQVFLNLLDNAVKFTPPGGKISVRARRESPYVCVEIQDSGIGIPPEHLSRVFERFYKIDKSRSRDINGTGLGLAIVKHIISTHQGKIEVESAVDQGTTFRIFLPCQV